jgi:hypothetical protein
MGDTQTWRFDKSRETVNNNCYLKQIKILFDGARMKRITTESRISQIKGILASDIDDEKVMMSVEKGQYYGLDPIGSRVWELIKKPIKVSALIDALLLKYDVEREVCERDVLAFLEDLYKDGILEVEG